MKRERELEQDRERLPKGMRYIYIHTYDRERVPKGMRTYIYIHTYDRERLLKGMRHKQSSITQTTIASTTLPGHAITPMLTYAGLTRVLLL